ncbi:MAG: hypothetical protein ACREMB_28130 [Candidatus Rokuibacteriota bacterium]
MTRVADAGDLRRRARLLVTVLAVAHTRFPPGWEPGVARVLRQWLDGWPGIGRVVIGMARQGYDVQLTRYGGEGWRASFYAAGVAHSVTSAVGSAWARTPWHAVQGAALQALVRADAA